MFFISSFIIVEVLVEVLVGHNKKSIVGLTFTDALWEICDRRDAHRKSIDLPGTVGLITLGHVQSSSLMLRLASHHLAVFRSCPVDKMTPLACRDAPAPAAAQPAPHTMLRIVFVAVDRTHV
jgi:hypothetical protein